jgi:hypothetical protein
MRDFVQSLSHATGKRAEDLMDLLYVALALGLFGLAWGLIKVCEHV